MTTPPSDISNPSFFYYEVVRDSSSKAFSSSALYRTFSSFLKGIQGSLRFYIACSNARDLEELKKSKDNSLSQRVSWITKDIKNQPVVPGLTEKQHIRTQEVVYVREGIPTSLSLRDCLIEFSISSNGLNKLSSKDPRSRYTWQVVRKAEMPFNPSASLYSRNYIHLPAPVPVPLAPHAPARLPTASGPSPRDEKVRTASELDDPLDLDPDPFEEFIRSLGPVNTSRELFKEL